VMQQLRRGGEGGNSCYLYDDSGALTLSLGFFGINDGVVRGSVEVTTAGAISLVGLTVSRWAKVEASVSGTSVTFEITSIAAASDPATLPTDFTAGYNGAKGGFYITATKRCIGVVWISAAGALKGIVNPFDAYLYDGYSEINSASSCYFRKEKGSTFTQSIAKPFHSKIIGTINHTSYPTQNDIFDALNNYIPTNGDIMRVSGGALDNSGTLISWIILSAARGAADITLYCMKTVVATGITSFESVTIANGSASVPSSWDQWTIYV